MAKPVAADVVAVGLLDRQPPIPYVMGGETATGLDCQGLIEYCVRQCGGTMAFLGSNDMFRNACTWVGTLAEARATGRLVPGTVVFTLKRDGREPDRYKADGKGNASHIGLVTLNARVEVVHASSGRGIVCESTVDGASWTHVGVLKAVDYTEGGDDMAGVAYRVAHADSGSSVNMRRVPNGDYMLRIPLGSRVPVMAESGGWVQTTYNGFTGWVDGRFLRAQDGPDDGAEGPEGGSGTLVGELPEDVRAAAVAAYEALGALLGR